MKRISPWRSVVEALEAEGIKRIYGLPGNPIHLVEDLEENTDDWLIFMQQPFSFEGIPTSWVNRNYEESL